MAENWGTPEEALARKKKQMDETYAAFKQAEAAAREGEKAGYEDVKILEERFNLALEEYKLLTLKVNPASLYLSSVSSLSCLMSNVYGLTV